MSGDEGQPSRKLIPRIVDAVPKALGGVVGLVASSLTGSPIVGPIVAPFTTNFIEFVRDYDRVQAARLKQMLEYAEEESPGLEVNEATRGDGARAELAARVVRAAVRTPIEGKLRALGIVLAWGLNPGGRVDEALLLAAALDDLEAFHVRVLLVLDDADQRVDSGAPGWDRQKLLSVLPELGTLASTVLRTLERHDLVRLSSAPWPSEHGFEYDGPFAVTEFGRLCLELVREQGREEAGQVAAQFRVGPERNPEPHPLGRRPVQ